jgi:hypothetical protein
MSRPDAALQSPVSAGLWLALAGGPFPLPSAPDQPAPPRPARLVRISLVGCVIFLGQLFSQVPRQVARDERHHHPRQPHSLSPRDRETAGYSSPIDLVTRLWCGRLAEQPCHCPSRWCVAEALIEFRPCQSPEPAAMTDTRSADYTLAAIFGHPPSERERQQAERIAMLEHRVLDLEAAVERLEWLLVNLTN